MKYFVIVIMLILLARYALGFAFFAFEASFRLLAIYLAYILFMGFLKLIFGRD